MEQQRSGFWSTLPGILTGSAALITAATGGYLALGRTADKPVAPNAQPAEAPAAASTPQTGAPPAPTPAVAVEAAPPEPASPEVPAAIADSGGSPSPIAAGEPRPSFNCALAATAVETMVCSDAELADRDRRVAAQYFALRGALPAGVRSQLLQSQRLFLRQRSDCRTSQCLSDLYGVRLRQLAEFASN